MSAFIPQAMRSLRRLPVRPLSHCALARRPLAHPLAPAPRTQSPARPRVPAPRMQFSSSGFDPTDPTDAPAAAGDTVVSKMQAKISTELNTSDVEIVPTYGDPNGAHVSIKVVSDAFEGLNSVKRHQAVYKVIWEELQGPVHAVDKLVTRTPAEDAA